MPQGGTYSQMRFDNLLRYAVRIISSYNGEVPLHNWLKRFFKDNPQMGSRDRKQVSEMVYCYFRLGHSLKNISAEERILTGIFLSNQTQEPLLEQLRPEWHAQTEKHLEEKFNIVCAKFPDFKVEDIFPWKDRLSKGIDHRAFCISFLQKPLLFIRIRPGKEEEVMMKLKNHKIQSLNADPDSILPFRARSFISGTKLDDVLSINREAVIQDLGSQHTALYMKADAGSRPDIWDCCAGSGGKSIMFTDLLPDCRLTVSDIRESILKNCSARFLQAGVQPAVLFKVDLTDQNDLPSKSFDYILADLPCTGSGTWSRSPEALYFFKPESILTYSQRQQQILSNVITHLKPGGMLFYITCSVFKDENENIFSYLNSTGILEPEKEQIIPGYDAFADSMYIIRYRKSSN
jgi:16S rRNA (cytosine967-C5)-methyltransferase